MCLCLYEIFVCTQDLGNELKTTVNEVTQAADFKLKQVQKELDEKKKVSCFLELTVLLQTRC